MNIPIKALRELSKKYGYDHIICFATKGEMQYVATYGNTIQACDEAAQFGDKMKDGLGWPESLHAAPSRVRSLQKRVKELEAQVESLLTMRAPDPLRSGGLCICGKPFNHQGVCAPENAGR